MTGQTSLCLGMTCTSYSTHTWVVSIMYHVSAVVYLMVIGLHLGIV